MKEAGLWSSSSSKLSSITSTGWLAVRSTCCPATSRAYDTLASISHSSSLPIHTEQSTLVVMMTRYDTPSWKGTRAKREPQFDTGGNWLNVESIRPDSVRFTFLETIATQNLSRLCHDQYEVHVKPRVEAFNHFSTYVFPANTATGLLARTRVPVRSSLAIRLIM